MSISLADRSVKYPRGIVENVLLKVDKFVFPVDFVVLDMEADDRVPLILGRPFLNTAKVLIDVFKGKITLQVGDETVTFSVMEKTKVDCFDREKSVSSIDARILPTDLGPDHSADGVKEDGKDLDRENQAIEITASPK
jgi:hypothetical protein